MADDETRWLSPEEVAAAEAELAGVDRSVRALLRVRPDPVWWDQDVATLVGWLRAEMLLELDREMATQVDGPALYGTGGPDNGLGVDFDVVLVPFKTWTAVPLHEPRGVLRGLLDSEGVTRHG